ncbi:2-haloacid dehalogenase [Salinibacterium amurskyense]|uniref:2-haloacid dehalogenase n=1 Tax=Salinibacterium amurskyense TaxID=205941 RepID=A0A2M9D983_9MICO|nr:HAD family hydrolase [Salinibacterium amurskyense]PJJ82212.1 2-haloacid dehalogenase [Salinibacterium amurskyense]RLQ81980.1 haloacid dehalogenase type II [Salinibacterium amurskyense]GHD77750.1 dehalogenase [Salinibacterium amurskyense]
MTNTPATIFFDVNETLSDLSPVGDAFEAVGATREVASSWFASILRDGFALTAVGTEARFLNIATTNARDSLGASPLNMPIDEAVDAVIAAFSNVSLHSDVAPGIRALHDAGHRLFTLSNGPASNAERMLTKAGVADAMAGFLSVEGNSPWKPARASYEDALTRTATSGVAHLVAVHPWDIHGAAEAGLSTVWVNRQGATYPAHFTAPTVTAETLEQLHTHLA